MEAQYYIDMVLCVDATTCMVDVIDEIKDELLNKFYYLVSETMEEWGKEIGQFRIKLIVAHDFATDYESGDESPFFLLPNQIDELRSFIDTIEVKGSPDPKNLIAAIKHALLSDWTTGGDRRRHIIVGLTNAEAAQPVDSSCMKEIQKLHSWWEGTDLPEGNTYQWKAGRLVVFAPNSEPWLSLQVFNRCWLAYGWIEQEDKFKDLDMLVKWRI